MASKQRRVSVAASEILARLEQAPGDFLRTG